MLKVADIDDHHDVCGYLGRHLFQSSYLLSCGFQQVTRRHALVARQCQLYLEKAVQLSVIDGGVAVAFRALAKCEVFPPPCSAHRWRGTCHR